MAKKTKNAQLNIADAVTAPLISCEQDNQAKSMKPVITTVGTSRPDDPPSLSVFDRLEHDIIEQEAAASPTIDIMATTQMITYVLQHHKSAIFPVKGKGKGWKTYVGTGKDRKQVERKEKQDLYQYLYDYYHHADISVQQVFDKYIEYRINIKDRSPKTIEADTCNFTRFADEKFRKKSFVKLREDDWRKLIVNVLKSREISQDGVKRFVLVTRSLYDFAIRQHLCETNEMTFIDYTDYYKSCKPVEHKEQIFTPEEEQKIVETMWERIDNPRAQMILLSAETGMRIGELAALHWEDITDTEIHICRQQVLDPTVTPQSYREVNYTKDERRRVPEGRWFPITENIRNVLETCKDYQAELHLEDDPVHVFCDQSGNSIKKDTAGKYLKRVCESLGITITRNHAFRKSLNSNVFEAMQMEHQQRSYLLGHSVRTNLSNYSCTRRENARTAGKQLDAWNAKVVEQRTQSHSINQI